MKLKLPELKFILFLFLICQPILPAKLLSLAFLSVHRNSLIDIINDRRFIFYLIMLLISIFYGAFFLHRENYLYAFLLALFFWTLFLIAFIQIKSFILNSTSENIHRVITILIILTILTTVFQFIAMQLKYQTIDPFSATEAAGDNLTGIFGNANANMVILSLCSFYFFFNKDYFLAISGLVLSFLTGYNGGIAILFLTVVLFVFLSSKTKKKQKLLLLGILVLGFCVVLFYLGNNIHYAYGFLERSASLDEFTPLKIKSFFITIENWHKNTLVFFVGEGPSNFSSRTAFLVSGTYVDWWPKSLVYISEAFRENNYYLWTNGFENDYTDTNSIANQPNSIIGQMIGEYGLVGIISLFLLYFRHLHRSNSLILISTIFMIGIFFIDYWFEFLNVVFWYELIYLKAKLH